MQPWWDLNPRLSNAKAGPNFIKPVSTEKSGLAEIGYQPTFYKICIHAWLQLVNFCLANTIANQYFLLRRLYEFGP